MKCTNKFIILYTCNLRLHVEIELYFEKVTSSYMYKFEYLFDEERERMIGNIKNSETNKIQ